jgi:hypothetical protein
LALGLVLAAAPAAGFDLILPAAAQETVACAKAEFESAVDEAAEALRDLNNKNRPEFQAKLRQLKDKRGWTNDQFMKEAAPFVKDNEITVYDEKSNELLATISSLGQEGAASKVPDCAMLTKLRDLMKVLIETQGSKWTYMFKKLDDDLAK